jgi:hypothetical protein
MEPRQLLTTFVVNNANDSGPGSLREAIIESDTPHSGADNIDFNLAPTSADGFDPGSQTWTINVLSPLPALTQQVTIDGLSQASTGVIYQYPQAASPTVITSAPSSTAAKDGNNATPRLVIEGNGTGGTGFILDAPDINLRGLIIDNFAVGVSVQPAAVGAVIQGNDIGAYQVFPVNTETGVAITGDPVNIEGLGNSLQGIVLASTNTTVGGVETQDANIIGNSGEEGILVVPGAHGNQILGNQIGVAGPAASTDPYFVIGNGSDGVQINDSSNYVGGQVSGDGNIISANKGDGVHIIGTAATRNDVEGNYIGIGPGGGFPLGSGDPGNVGDGVTIDGAAGNQIGGSTSAAQNVISSNGSAGVRVFDETNGTSAIHNMIQGNIIGLTSDGVSVLGNAQQGVVIASAQNTVDDTNIISANLDGVLLSGTGATGNLINGNYIGTNGTGTGKLGNVNAGIDIESASNNTISGNAKPSATSGLQIISGNNVGVLINGIAATANQILGNFIGTDITGTIDLGNALQGVEIDNAPGNTIGNTTTTGLNLISANYTGVEIIGGLATNNVIQSNKIGTDITGTLPLGNETDGVFIHQGASNNLIGGSTAAAGNTIAFNSRDGVRIQDASNGNSILSNSIFANGGLGIDLVSSGNPATSPTIVNPPSLSAVATSITSTIITGTLNGTPNSTYTIQFFSSATQDPTGVGEGGQYLGQTSVITGPNGIADFSANLPSLLKSGQYVTATATDSAGNTSLFSSPVTQIFGTVQFQMTNYTVSEDVGTVTITATRTGGSGGYFTVGYATADGTAQAGTDYSSASGTLTFDPGVDSQAFSIQIDDNGLPSADKTVLLSLSNPVGPIDLGSQSSAVLTILGNQPSALQFQAASTIVDEAAGTATITVARQSGTTQTSVNYSTAGGTAIPGVDYTPTSGTLTFEPGQLTQSFTVPILINPQITGNVSVNLTLSNPTNGSALGDLSSAVLVIQPGFFQFQTSAYYIGEADGNAIVTVSRTSSVGTATVNYSTANGSAVAGVDYVPTAGTLTFTPGQLVESFVVPTLIDPLIKGNLAINLSLSSPIGAILGSPSMASVVIIDDGVDRQGPHVTSVKAVAGPVGVDEVVLTFDEALNPTTAVNLLNYGYSVRTPGKNGKLGTKTDHLVGIRSASYNPATFTVTLPLAAALKNGTPLEIMLNQATDAASVGVGISDLLGNLLDGDDNGYPGGSFTAKVVAEAPPKTTVHSTKTKHSSPKVKTANHKVTISSVKSHPGGPSKSHAATPTHRR